MTILRTVLEITTYSRSSEGVFKIFPTDAVKINLTSKRVCRMPTSNQLRATWHTDSQDLTGLQSTGALRYQICRTDGGTSSEYFGIILVCIKKHDRALTSCRSHSERINKLNYSFTASKNSTLDKPSKDYFCERKSAIH
jgi:hypothetical protein